MIKIAADSQIPNLESRLSELFDAEYSLQYFESDQLKSNDLKDIDALLVRSTVQVDQELCNKLSNSVCWLSNSRNESPRH